MNVKARCPFCSRIVAVTVPGGNSSPWFSLHKINAGGRGGGRIPCIGSLIAAPIDNPRKAEIK